MIQQEENAICIKYLKLFLDDKDYSDLVFDIYGKELEKNLQNILTSIEEKMFPELRDYVFKYKTVKEFCNKKGFEEEKKQIILNAVDELFNPSMRITCNTIDNFEIYKIETFYEDHTDIMYTYNLDKLMGKINDPSSSFLDDLSKKLPDIYKTVIQMNLSQKIKNTN